MVAKQHESVELDKLGDIADEQTKMYLRKIVPIHAERMQREGILCWWNDEILLVVFAGLLKNKLLELPEQDFLQTQEIARICDVICMEADIKTDIFILSVGGAMVHEYVETMKKVQARLLV